MNKGRTRRWSLRLGFAATLALAACTQGWAMGKMILFSAVSGKVLLDGKPVPGAKVEREFRWSWKDEIGKDSTTTGAAGEFSFAKIERSSFLGSLLPHEPVVRQSLTIQHGGKAYEAWLLNKHNYDDNGEVEGKALRLVCRLEATPGKHPGGYYGICELE
jgi:hypothetical protein